MGGAIAVSAYAVIGQRYSRAESTIDGSLVTSRETWMPIPNTPTSRSMVIKQARSFFIYDSFLLHVFAMSMPGANM